MQGERFKLLLAVIVALLSFVVWGELSVDSVFIRFLLAYLLIWVGREAGSEVLRPAGLAYLGALLRLLFKVLGDISLFNLRMAKVVLSPRPVVNPMLISLDLTPLQGGETVLLALIITLAPGTLALDLDTSTGRMDMHSILGTRSEALQSVMHYQKPILALRR